MEKDKTAKSQMTTFHATLLGIFAFTFAYLFAGLLDAYYPSGSGIFLNKALSYGIGFALGAAIGSGIYRLLKLKFPETTQKIDKYLVFE